MPPGGEEGLEILKPQSGFKFREWKDESNKKIENVSKDFVARDYQLEMLDAAKRENTIILMPTGAGKTFVAVLLIKHYSYELQKPIQDGGKRTFFLVNQVTLVAQQGKVLEDHTGLRVGKYSGASNKGGKHIDSWDKEFWRQEFYLHEIIVCTAEIFRQLLSHAFISATDVNVLVLDECHHAKLNKGHPMTQIMKNFWSQTPGAGRVLGLTASVIDQRNCKVESLRTQLKDLEKCLQCKIVTPRQFSADLDTIEPPQPQIEPFDYTEYGQVIKDEFDDILIALLSVGKEDCPGDDYRTYKKVKHTIRILPFIIKEVGLDALRRSLPDYINEIEHFLRTPLLVTGQITRYMITTVLSQCNVLLGQINRILERGDEVRMSPKFYALLKYIINERRQRGENEKEEARVIIFEEKRIIVKVMWKYLTYLKSEEGVEECSFMKSGYVLGGSSAGRDEDEEPDIIEIEKVKKIQEQTLQDFRSGKLNILIATSVVEEGLDIPACNIVVRYSFPPTYRAFVQSRGRARARPGRFVFFIDKSEIEPRMIEIRNYDEIENFLKDYASSEREQEDSDDDNTEEIPSLYVEVTGAKVTADMAIQLLNFYCDQLPKDDYTDTLPKEKTIRTNFDGFLTTLTLPKLCPIRQVTGKPMHNRKDAKKSAAMEAVKQLYLAKELDTHLLPQFRQKENSPLLFEKEGQRSLLLDQKIKIPSIFWRKDMLNSQSVTSAGRVVVNEYHIYAIEMTLTPKVDNFEEYFSSSPYHEVSSYGIISPSRLPDIPIFDVYPRYGIVEVKIRYIKTIKVPPPQVISKLSWFHSTIFTKILALQEISFIDNFLFKNYLIVPLTVKAARANLGCNFGSTGTGSVSTSTEVDIAYSFITKLKARWNEEENCWIFGSIPQSADLCRDCVLFQHYFYKDNTDNSNIVNAYFIVMGQSELTANSIIKHGTANETYLEHHLKKYPRAVIVNSDEHLLKCRHVSKKYNMLNDKGKKQDSTDYAGKSTLDFIREVHKVHPFPASLWNQATCLPSILWRMETLCLTGELYEKLLPGQPSNDGLGHLQSYVNINSRDLIAKLDKDNNNDDINTVSMIQCLTTAKCGEKFSLERLEFLGDSFLKFIMAIYFYRIMPDKHEGWLSKFRSEIVSNEALTRRAIDSIDLPRYIFNMLCQPQTNWLPPNYLPKVTLDKLLKKVEELHPEDQPVQSTNQSTVHMSHESLSTNQSTVHRSHESLSTNQSTVHRSHDTFQPINELSEDQLIAVLNEHIPVAYLQDMGSKNIADSIEALIGLFVSQGGYGAAVNLLDTIGLSKVPGVDEVRPLCNVLYNEPPPPQVIATTAAHRQLTTSLQIIQLQQRLGYTFREPLYLLEALTHATYSDITACYQRLEYLGDAVLDELMVCHIFENNSGLDPGQLTDLKSTLVCNTTLSKVSMKYGFHTNILYDSHQLYLTLNRFYKNFQDKEAELAEWYTTNFTLSDVVYDSSEEETHQIMDLDQVVQVPKILGDVVESVIGAIYLDCGECMMSVWNVIWPWFEPFYNVYSNTIPKQPKAQVHELYPSPRVQITAPKQIDSHRVLITVTIVTVDGDKYSFPTIGRDQMSVRNVCFDRALRFHMDKLA